MPDTVKLVNPIHPVSLTQAQDANLTYIDFKTFVWKNIWSANPTAYNVYDVVYYNGSAYVNKTGINTTTAPSSDTTNWSLMVSKGDQGPSGAVSAGYGIENTGSSSSASLRINPTMTTTGGVVSTTNKLAVLNNSGNIDVNQITISANSSTWSANNVVTKQYADSIAAGMNWHDACDYATAAVLPNSPNYTDGSADASNGLGVGAYLQATANATLSVDGNSTWTVGQRILVKDQVNAKQNGIYTVSSAGSGSSLWKLIRATDTDNSTAGQVKAGDSVFVISGSVNAGQGFVQTTVGTNVDKTIKINGTTGDNIAFTQFTGIKSLGSQSANTVLAAPDGSTGTPTFRSIATNDLPNAGASGTYTKVTTDSKGRVTSGTSATASDVGALAATASAGGDLTGNYPNPTLVATGTSGTYTKVTTDSKGRVTSGTTLSSSDLPSVYIGTTSIPLSRSSASQTLTGISIDGNAATVTNGFYTTSTFNLGTTSVAVNRTSASQSLTGISIDGSAGSVAAANITGTTLASNVVSSSLTSVGTLANLTVTNAISGSVTGNAATVTNGAYINVANTFTAGPQTINIDAASNKGIVIKAAASQTANLQEWQNNSGTALSSISASGGGLFSTNSTTGIPLIAKQSASSATGASVTGLTVTTTASTNLATLSATTGLTPNTTYVISSTGIPSPPAQPPVTFTTGSTLSTSIFLSSTAGVTAATNAAATITQLPNILEIDDPNGGNYLNVDGYGRTFVNNSLTITRDPIGVTYQYSPTVNTNAGGAFSTTGTYWYIIVPIYVNGDGTATSSRSASVAATTSTVTLSWPNAKGATGYKIYRNTSNAFTTTGLLLTTITSSQTTTYTDTGTATQGGSAAPSASTSGNTFQILDQAGSLSFSVNKYGSVGAYQGIYVSGSANSVPNAYSLASINNSTNSVMLLSNSAQISDLLRLGTNSTYIDYLRFDKAGNQTSHGTNVRAANLDIPVISNAATSTASGSVPAGTYYYVMTAVNNQGETIQSNILGPATLASTGTITFSYNTVIGATSYKVYRSTTSTFTSGSLLLATISAATNTIINGNNVATTASSTSATLATTNGLSSGTTYRIYSSTIPQANNITFTYSGSASITLSSSTGVTTGTATTTIIPITTYADTASATSTGLPPTSTTGTNLTIQAWSGQTGNIQEWQNSSGTALASVDSSGRLIVGTGAQSTLNGRTVAAFSQPGANGTAIEINAPTGGSNIFFGPAGQAATGQISVDSGTANGMLLYHNANILRLARPASGGATFYSAVSMPYTATTTATTLDGTHYTLDCTSGTFTVTLPAASTTLGQAGFTGRIYNIKNSGTGTITIATTSSQTIDGASTITMNGTTKQYQTITVQSTGTGWIII